MIQRSLYNDLAKWKKTHHWGIGWGRRADLNDWRSTRQLFALKLIPDFVKYNSIIIFNFIVVSFMQKRIHSGWFQWRRYCYITPWSQFTAYKQKCNQLRRRKLSNYNHVFDTLTSWGPNKLGGIIFNFAFRLKFQWNVLLRVQLTALV